MRWTPTRRPVWRSSTCWQVDFETRIAALVHHTGRGKQVKKGAHAEARGAHVHTGSIDTLLAYQQDWCRLLVPASSDKCIPGRWIAAGGAKIQNRKTALRRVLECKEIVAVSSIKEAHLASILDRFGIRRLIGTVCMLRRTHFRYILDSF